MSYSKCLLLLCFLFVGLQSCIDNDGGGGSRTPAEPVTGTPTIISKTLDRNIVPASIGTMNPTKDMLTLNTTLKENEEFQFRFNFPSEKKTKLKIMDWKIESTCPKSENLLVRFALIKRTPVSETIVSDLVLNQEYEILSDNTYTLLAVGSGVGCSNITISVLAWTGTPESQPVLVKTCSMTGEDLDGQASNQIIYWPLIAENKFQNLYTDEPSLYLGNQRFCGTDIQPQTNQITFSYTDKMISVRNEMIMEGGDTPQDDNAGPENQTKSYLITFDEGQNKGQVECFEGDEIKASFSLLECSNRIREKNKFE